MRIITVEEHFHHPESVARVLELSGLGPITPDAGFGEFLGSFMPDRESAERLAGKRLAHMDSAGIDVQVVSHGANSPGKLSACGTAINAVNMYPHARTKTGCARDTRYCANSRTAVTRSLVNSIDS